VSIKLRRQDELQRKWSIVWYFHLKYFTSQLFYVEIFYGWKQSVKLLVGKHELAMQNFIIKVCSIEYLTTQIELVLPTFKSWAVDKIIEYLSSRLLRSLWNIYHGTTAYFFDPPCSYSTPNPLHREFLATPLVERIRYDTRCYFNVRSKADMSQLNLQRQYATHIPIRRDKIYRTHWITTSE